MNCANSCLISTGEPPAAAACPPENMVCAGAGLLTIPGVPANIVALVRLCMAEADTICAELMFERPCMALSLVA